MRYPDTFRALVVTAAALAACSPSGEGARSREEPHPQRVTVSVDPAAAQVSPGGTARFAAIVTGTADVAVVWDVAETGGGIVDATGLYTAPAAPGLFHVRATSRAAPSVSGQSAVSVVPPVSVSISPKGPAIAAGGTIQFSAVVSNASNTAVTWSVPTAGCGSITPAGLYTAPAVAGVCTVVATSLADATKSDSTTVTVMPPVSVAIAPKAPSVLAGGSIQFSAIVSNASNTAVTWSVPTAGCGSITAAGLYTAPGLAGVCTVVATSQADATKSDSAIVTVTAPPPPVVVTITPSPAAVDTCGTATFSATVSNASNTSVTWSVQEGATGGAITATGVYTAPSNAGTYHVVATSNADPTSLATVAVTAADRVLAVDVSPQTVQVPPGGTAQLTATVTTTCGTFASTSTINAAGQVVAR